MKRKTVWITLFVVGLLCVSAVPKGSSSGASAENADAGLSVLKDAYGSLPVSFEENRGQADASVRFLSRGNGYSVFLTGTEAVVALRQASPTSGPNAVLRMRLIGANPAASVAGTDELPGKSAYFIGNDPRFWRSGIANYARVRYSDVFPGVDLVYYGKQGQLEYDFVVAPGADPRQIRLGFTGAQRIRLEKGDIVAQIPGGDVRLHQPVLYQQEEGRKFPVEGRFVLAANHQVAFAVGHYDKHAALVIDPSLVYSTYLGGSQLDQGLGVAVDDNGSAYVTGSTTSADFPTTPRAAQHTSPSARTSAFVAKLDPGGTTLLYSTFLGGGNSEVGRAIAVNRQGEAYVAGSTYSSDFPATAGALQRTSGGGQDAFAVKLSADGSRLIYATYLGGSGDEEARSLAIDKTGNAYITGSTGSRNFPTTAQAFQKTSVCAAEQSCEHAFVSKLNASGSALLYSSFLGGSRGDSANAIALDLSGAAYVAGHTYSTDFPVTAGTLQPKSSGHTACATAGRTCADVFVSKFSTSGALLYSTFLGGSGDQRANAIAVDSSGAAYITGRTDSHNFPVTARAFARALPNEGSSAFVSKLNAQGSSLDYSTYFGGGADEALAIAVDRTGRASLAGSTASTTFPTSAGAFQRRLAGTRAAFWAQLDADGSGLLYSTLLSGSGSDVAAAIALDGKDNVYVVGNTDSKDFPVRHPLRAVLEGTGSAFVAKFSPKPPSGTGTFNPSSLVFTTAFGTPSAPKQSTFSNTGTGTLNISAIAISGNNSAEFSFQNPPPTGACTVGTALNAGQSCTVNVVFNPAAPGTRTASVVITDNGSPTTQSLGLSGSGTGPFVNFNPTSLSFINQTPGTTSAAKTVVLTNTGTTTLSSIVVAASGTNATDFTVTTTPTPNCGGSLAANATCTISVTFKPGAAGLRVGSIKVTDNAFNSPQSAPLIGNPPVASLTPATLTFASQPEGSVSTSKVVTLTNTALFTALNVTTIAVNSPNFEQSNNCPIGGTLAATKSCAISVAFTPGATGTLTGKLIATDNSQSIAGATQTTSLSGTATGAPTVTITPSSLTFPSQLQGTSSTAQSVTVTNNGTQPLTFSNLFLTSTSDFQLITSSAANNLCVFQVNPLPASASCVASVTFSPTLNNVTGLRTADLIFADNDGNGSNLQQLVPLSGTATGAPAVSISTTSLTFGSQLQGTSSASQTVTVTNTGTTPLNFDNLFASSSDFTLATSSLSNNACVFQVSPLPPSASCVVIVSFTPTVTNITGLRTGTISIVDHTGNSSIGLTQLVNVSGTATGAPAVNLSATSLAFGNQLQGTSGAPQTVNLKNTGNTPLSLSNLTFASGSGNYQFVTSSVSNNLCLFQFNPVPPGSTCVITAFFSPVLNNITGPRPDTIVITDNAGDVAGSQQLIVLNGTATGAPAVTLSASSLSFPNQAVGTTSPPQTLTLKNTGNTPLNFNNAFVQTGDFTMTGTTCSSPVNPGLTCTVSITFNPGTTGSRTDFLDISDNAGNDPSSQQVVPLTGTATGAPAILVSLAPGMLAFGTQPVGTIGNPLSLTLTNKSSLPLTVTTVSTNIGDFQAINNCRTPLTTVAPGNTCTLTVNFVPQVNGTRVGNMTISESTSATSSSQVIALTGIGGGTLSGSLSATSLSFGNQVQGTVSATQLLTLTNNGTSGLPISDLFASFSNINVGTGGNFAETTNCPVGGFLGAGAHCTISVTFTPQLTFVQGTRTGNIVVQENSNDTTAEQLVSLTGTATGAPAATLSPATLTFANQLQGTTSTAQVVTLTNTGNLPFSPASPISNVFTNTTNFSQTNTCPINGTLHPGGACSIFVTFNPQVTDQAGTLTDTLSAQEVVDANSSIQTVALTGTSTGVPMASFSPTSLTFGNQILGTTSAPQAVKITNTGSLPLNITSVLVSSSEFVLFNNCNLSLAPGASCSVFVNFSPQTTGSISDALVVQDNSGGTPNQQIVPLTGFGTN